MQKLSGNCKHSKRIMFNRFRHRLKQHSYQKDFYFCYFLQIRDKLVDEYAFKITVYRHKPIAPGFLPEETQVETQYI